MRDGEAFDRTIKRAGDQLIRRDSRPVDAVNLGVVSIDGPEGYGTFLNMPFRWISGEVCETNLYGTYSVIPDVNMSSMGRSQYMGFFSIPLHLRASIWGMRLMSNEYLVKGTEFRTFPSSHSHHVFLHSVSYVPDHRPAVNGSTRLRHV